MVELLERHDEPLTEQAGIRLRDKPSPLYRLSVLTLLLAAPISAGIAVAAARGLAEAGLTTPRRMADASHEDRVAVLDAAGYVRYDERTATALGNGAELLLRHYRGDLRELRERAKRQPERIRELLTELPGIGPTAATIFCREAQRIWPELRPCFDAKALEGARKLGLPTEPEALAELVEPEQLPAAAAALVRARQTK